MHTMSNKKVLSILLFVSFVLTQLFSGILTVSATEKYDIKSITVKTLTKNTPVREGERIVITGEGLNSGKKIMSIGIFPANVALNGKNFYDKITYIYSNEKDTTDIKNGKFSISTSLVSDYETGSIKKGTYKVVIWWVTSGSKGDHMTVSKSGFNVTSDSKLIALKNISFDMSPKNPGEMADWTMKFTPDKDKTLNSGDFIHMGYMFSEAALNANTTGKIETNGKSTTFKLAITSSKNNSSGMKYKEMTITLLNSVSLKANKEVKISIKNIKNPNSMVFSTPFSLYTKNNTLIAGNHIEYNLPDIEGNEDILGGDSDITINIEAKPPRTISLNQDKQSEPISFSISFSQKNDIPEKFSASIVDDKGNHISEGNINFYKDLGEGNLTYSTMEEVKVVDGKAVFSGLVLKAFDTQKAVEKIIRIKFWSLTDSSVKPVLSEPITIQ